MLFWHYRLHKPLRIRRTANGAFVPLNPEHFMMLAICGDNHHLGLVRCLTAREAGPYTAADWENASKYTDDTAAKTLVNSLSQMA